MKDALAGLMLWTLLAAILAAAAFLLYGVAVSIT
jgi:hypothetical protein